MHSRLPLASLRLSLASSRPYFSFFLSIYAPMPLVPYHLFVVVLFPSDFWQKKTKSLFSQVIAVYRGTLDLHGQPRSVTWTRLSTPAPKGSSTLCLLRKIDWPVNSHVVVASTDYDRHHAETRVITAVTDAGTCLQLDRPLDYSHDGEWLGCYPCCYPCCYPAAIPATWQGIRSRCWLWLPHRSSDRLDRSPRTPQLRRTPSTDTPSIFGPKWGC